MADTHKKPPARKARKKKNVFFTICEIIGLVFSIIYRKTKRFFKNIAKRVRASLSGLDLSYFGDNRFIALAVAFVALIIIIIGLVWSLTNKNAYEISINDSAIGIIKAAGGTTAETTAETLTSAVTGRLSNELGVKVMPSEQVAAIKIHSSKKKIDTEEYIISKLIDTIKYQIEALAVTLDGVEIAVLKNEAEYDILKSRLFAPYRASGTVVISEDFVEDIKTSKKFIDAAELTSVEEAYNILSATYQIETVYVLQSGDTLLPIAKKYGTTVDAIMTLNGMQPGDERRLSAGREIKIPIKKPMISVSIVEEAKYTADVEYEIIRRVNPGAGTGQITLQEGVNGKAEIVAHVTYVNGAEQSREIISETVITPPINEVIEVGA